MKEHGLKTRILSAVLCALMVGTALPVQALASGSGTAITAETETADTTVDGVFSTVLPVEEETTANNTAVDGVFSTVMEIEDGTESESEQGQIRNLRTTGNEGIATVDVGVTMKITLLGYDMNYDLNGSENATTLVKLSYVHNLIQNTVTSRSDTAIGTVEYFSYEGTNQIQIEWISDGTYELGYKNLYSDEMYGYSEVAIVDASEAGSWPDEKIISSCRYAKGEGCSTSTEYVMDLKDVFDDLDPSKTYQMLFRYCYQNASGRQYVSYVRVGSFGFYSTLKLSQPSGNATSKTLTASEKTTGVNSHTIFAYWWSNDPNNKPTETCNSVYDNKTGMGFWTKINTLTVTEPGTYYCWGGSNYGNKNAIVSYAKITTTGLDSTPPTVDVSYSTTEWTCKDVTITANASDSSGIGGYYWTTGTETPTASSTWVSDNTKTVSTNGTWYVWAKDKAGNISTAPAKAEVTNIDKNAPTASVTIESDTGAWAKTVTLTITGTDEESGIAGYLIIPYSSSVVNGVEFYDGKIEDADLQLNKWVTGNSITIKANAEYYCGVVDKAGNRSVLVYKSVTNIDNTAPTVTELTAKSDYVSEYSRGPVTLTCKASDSEAGVAGYYFSKVNSQPTADAAGWVTGKTKVLSSQEDNGTWYAWAKDAVGNISATPKSVEVKIDMIAPVLSVSYSNTDKWTKKDVVVTLNCTDEGGSGIMGYSWDDLTGWTTDTTRTFSYNGTWYVFARDKAGNDTKKVTVTISNIDQGVPSVTLSKDSTDEDGFVNKVTITATATDELSGIAGYTWGKYAEGLYRIGAPSSLEDIKDNVEDPLEKGWVTNNTLTVTENGTYYCGVVDNVLNVNKGIVKINVSNIDSTAPTISKVTLSYRNKWTTNKTITVTAADNDGGSGLHSEAYSFDGGATWQSKNTYTVTANGTYDIRVRDVTGNIASATETVSYIAAKPSVILEQVGADPNQWVKKATVKLTYVSGGPDILAVYINVSSDGGYGYMEPSGVPDLDNIHEGIIEGDWGTYEENISGGYQFASNWSTPHKYTVWVYDALGQMSDPVTLELFKVDGITPQLYVTSTYHDGWTGVYATYGNGYGMTQDSISGIMAYYWSQNDGTAPTYSSSNTIYNTDILDEWTTSTSCTVTTNKDVYGWVVDYAGNISNSVQAFGAQYPAVNITLNTPTDDKSASFTVTSADLDDGDGRAYQYCVRKSNTAPSGLSDGTAGELDKWISLSDNTFTVTSNGTYYVWVRTVGATVSIEEHSITINSIVSPIDVTVPINPTITLQPGVSDEAQTGTLTITNNSTNAGVKVALGSIVAMDGQGAKLSLVKGDTTFAEGDDLLSAGAALGVKVSGGSTVWYDPTSTAQTVFATISAGGSVNFQYVMKHSPYYSGAATTFGYKISYNFETAS